MSNTKPESRPVSYSRTEQAHIVMPGDCNQYFRLFGGQLMQWIDTVAAIVARRHAGNEVTTASIDRLDFLAPASLNNVVVLQGRLIHVGRTSMLIVVETYTESLHSQRRTLVNKATLTLVAIDEDGQPTAVPRLFAETEEEEADLANGKALYQTKRASRSL